MIRPAGILLALTILVAGCGGTRELSALSVNHASTGTLPASAASRGPVPRGWRVYRGRALPLVIAYPHTWTVDESNASVGEISFSSPRATVVTTVGMRAQLPAERSLVVARRRLASFATRGCESGTRQESASTRVMSGVRMATEVAVCATGEENEGASGTLTYFIGIAHRDAQEWTFVSQVRGADFSVAWTRFISRMLQSVAIYGNH